ncbi:hypothetical protein Q4Q35_01425 [Flavivirga aquimarina]|uniref:Uncharacterized protein n=1 Tax=Flavivirga aquimarina TaxID=2027862 RepID=A0ABT8W5V4_9FLAO|nr:hypothetical protein [Flavivirga aquimarina]MDO5968457.1 hypothetical protein [Flavivirga aquimarina]
MKATLYIISLVISTSCFGQDFKYFDFKSKFDWSQIETDKVTTNLLESNYDFLKGNPYPELEYILENMDKYHLFDINNDNINELIFNGWNGGEGEMVVIYKLIGEHYEENQNFFGRIVDIIQTEPNQTKLMIYDYACCGGYVDNIETFNYNSKKQQFEIVNSVAKIDLTTIPTDLIKPIKFEIRNTPYNLRYLPEIAAGPKDGEYDFNAIQGQNIAAIYKTGDTGTVYAESKDSTGRVWWFVVMDSKPDSGETLYYDGNNHIEDYKPIGWLSSRYVEIID